MTRYYRISPQDFKSNKSLLNGIVFWRKEDDYVLIKTPCNKFDRLFHEYMTDVDINVDPREATEIEELTETKIENDI